MIGGIVVPLALFVLAAMLGDTGGPLFWPLLSLLLGGAGGVTGLIAKYSDRREEGGRSPDCCTKEPGRSGHRARVVAGLAMVLGAGLLAGSWGMPMMRDAAEYQRQYEPLGLHRSDDERFYELRREFLTPRTACEDYGGALIAGGLMLLLATRWRHCVAAVLNSRSRCFAFGMLVVLASALGSAASLLLAYERGEFPWWRDSMGRPLGGVVVVAIIQAVWFSVHAELNGAERAEEVGGWGFRWWRAWLVFQIGCHAALLGWSLLRGDFLMVVPRALQGMFFYALLQGTEPRPTAPFSTPRAFVGLGSDSKAKGSRQ